MLDRLQPCQDNSLALTTPLIILKLTQSYRYQNPLVYTKLNCYLPWIAEQYNLEYDQMDDVDASCTTGSGEKAIDDEKTCHNTPSSFVEQEIGLGAPCIFPYYLDGKLVNDTCSKFNEDAFLDPVSRCPIYNVTTKINGISSYNSSDPRLIYGGYCIEIEDILEQLGLAHLLDELGVEGVLWEALDIIITTGSIQNLLDQINLSRTSIGGKRGLQVTLNPDNDNCLAVLRHNPFSKCQNNCRGGMQILFLSSLIVLFQLYSQ